MKRTIVLTLLALLGFTAAHAQRQFATLDHNSIVTVFYGPTSLASAHAAAVDGDIITLSEGAFQSTSISKAVTIRGAGMYADPEVGTLPTVIVGNVTLLYNGTSEDHIRMEGLRLVNTLVYGDIDTPDISHLEVTKCEIEDIKGGCYFDDSDNYPRSYLQYAQFVDCVIKNFAIRTKHPDYNENASNFHNHVMHSSFTNCVILFMHNVFHIDWQTVEDIHFNTMNNCVLRLSPDYMNGFDLTINNSIIYGDESAGEATTMPTVYNSIGIISGNNFFDSSIMAGQNLHNYDTLSVVFKNFDGTYNYGSTTFELKDTVAATMLGTDGTQVGIYGGQFPFNPKVLNYSATVANQSRPDGKLEVTIQPIND